MHAGRAAALAVVVSVLLAGCARGETEPRAPTSTSSSPSGAPTAAETPEPESARHFIRRWVKLNNEMLNGRDTDAYLAASQRCRTCVATAVRVNGVLEAGGSSRTEGWSVLEVTDRSRRDGVRVYDLVVRTAPTAFTSESGSEPFTYPGGVLTYRLQLTTGPPWSVTRLTVVA